MRTALTILITIISTLVFSQNVSNINSILVEAKLDSIKSYISVKQEITYTNKSEDILDKIYLHAWAGAYSSRESNLGQRIRENRKIDFYLSKREERGFISGLEFKVNDSVVKWSYASDSKDIVVITLNQPLLPGEQINITTPFKLKLPDSKFTGFGYSDDGYFLKDWFLVPAVYRDGKWVEMNNLGLDDLFAEPHLFVVKISLPDNFKLSSNLLFKNNYLGFGKYEMSISGYSIEIPKVVISFSKDYSNFQIESQQNNLINIETDLQYPLEMSMDRPYSDLLKRQIDFIESYLGQYKLPKLWVSSDYIKNNPIYSMNTIPMVKTMGPKFQREIEIFKSISYAYIKSSIFANQRENSWMIEGLNSFLLSKYIEKYFPEKKLFGNLSDYWISRYFDLSELKFNDRQELLYIIMARQNLDQSIGIKYDKFANLNLLAINQFKTSIGLNYLSEYIGIDKFEQSLKKTFDNPLDFYIDSNTMKNIFAATTDNRSDWFFDDFIADRKLIDYKSRRVNGEIEIVNKTQFSGPVQISEYKNDSLLAAVWIDGFKESTIYHPQSDGADRIVINDRNIIPEYNRRDNTQKINPKWYHIFNKPLQLKLFRDIEDPNYNQVFFNPNGEWNAYDGIIFKGNFYNKSIIRKPLEYKLSPSYASKPGKIIGSGTINYTYLLRDSDYLQSVVLGFYAKYSHYDIGLKYFKFNPVLKLYFRRPDPRGVEINYLMLRYVSVEKEKPQQIVGSDFAKYEEYKVLNLRHVYEDPEIISDFRIKSDLQIGDKFGKVSSEIRIRKITNWDRLVDIRLFGGLFLYNNVGNTYYDFGVNSSTDYLFDYQLLGRSETSGILSQQIVVNDGGFKSYYNTFANDWMLSLNAHFAVWKFVEIYGDAALYSNIGFDNKYVWDSGIRLNFIPELLELYFPLYSSQGSELVPNYHQKIRFVFTADFGEIVKYFRRGLF